MKMHKVYLGGGFRTTGYIAHPFESAGGENIQHYAGHLPTRGWVVPFEYDGASRRWQNYHDMAGAFETGDTVETHALVHDSRVNAIVIQNKKVAGIKDDVTGAVKTPAKVKFGLYDGETLVDETDEIDLSVVGRTILEFGKPTAAKASTKKDANADGKVDAKDQPATAVTSLGAYLGSNGTVRMTVVDGSGIMSACMEVFADVTDFAARMPCSCDVAPCAPVQYPDPMCM